MWGMERQPAFSRTGGRGSTWKVQGLDLCSENYILINLMNLSYYRNQGEGGKTKTYD